MHGKKIINNSMIGIIYKIVILLLGFITRKIFIIYIGEELLGLNSLYVNLLDLLNLADLGIGVAVQYLLYEPLVKKDNDRLSRIMSAARKLYNTIGMFIIAAGIVLSVFLPVLIKSTTYPWWFVRIAFIISVLGVALGYFFVHKRLFFSANEEFGLINIIDLTAKITTVVISLIVTIVFQNYIAYLIINALNALLSNLIINHVFNKRYPEIKSNYTDCKVETKELTQNLKNVIPMKLSNYVYNSTDNLIISKVLGLSTVALYSNYMVIINGIMSVEYLFGNIITSSIGKIIKENKPKDKIFRDYLVFQYMQYILTSFCTVSLAVLCAPFITWWIGDRFVLAPTIFVLLVVDFFIHSMYQPAYVMYGAAGKFKEDKYVTMMSAIINIVISIIMVNIIGLPGVIVGTIITDIYIWTVRSWQVVKGYFAESLIRYGMKMLKYIVCTVVALGISLCLSRFVIVDNLILEIIIKAFICLLVPNALNLVITFRSEEFKAALGHVKKYLQKRG